MEPIDLQICQPWTHLLAKIIEIDKMSAVAAALIDGGVFAPAPDLDDDEFTSGGQNITALTITDE